MKNVLIQKNKKYMNFEFILEFNLIILMWWQYFLFSEWMLEQCIFLILLFMSVKIVGSWKNDEQREMLLMIWKKSWNWFLKQEKAVKKQKLVKKKWRKIEKEKEGAVEKANSP